MKRQKEQGGREGEDWKQRNRQRLPDIGSAGRSEATLNNFAVYPRHRYANLSRGRGVIDFIRAARRYATGFSDFISRTNNKLPRIKYTEAHKQSRIRLRGGEIELP